MKNIKTNLVFFCLCIIFSVFSSYAALKAKLSAVAQPGYGLAKSESTDTLGAISNLFFREFHTENSPEIAPLPLRLKLTNDSPKPTIAIVSLWAEDIFGNKVDWQQTIRVQLPEGPATVEKIIPFRCPTGFYKIHAELSELQSGTLAKRSAVEAIEIASAPTKRPGNVKEGFFMYQAGDEKLMASIGMQLCRVNLENINNRFQSLKNAGMWPWPGYDRPPDFTKQPVQYDEWLSRFPGIFEKNYREHPDVITYEFLNEPWIYHFTWQAPAENQRYVLKKFCQMARKVNPNFKITACSSDMLFIDVHEEDPEVIAGLSGISNHPYNPSTQWTSSRPGDFHSDLDMGIQAARRNGLFFNACTEGAGQSPHITGKSTPVTAAQVVEHYVMHAMTGWMNACIQAGGEIALGLGEGWTASNSAFAVLAYMITDRPCVADIWPYNELLWGGIFANKKFITDEVKALPRANDINARWNCAVAPENENDNTIVAIIWGYTGQSNFSLDQNGQIIIPDATGLQVVDMMGAIKTPQNGKYTLPFGQFPLYIITNTLSVIELRNRIRQSTFTGLTPVNMYALSLSKPADQLQEIIVRVENQMPYDITGTLTIEPLAAPGKTGSASFCIAEGRLCEVRVQWPGAPINENNVYGIKMTAQVKAKADGTPLNTVIRQHIINTAVIAKRTITVNGSLDDWSGVTPVPLDCRQATTQIESDLSSFINTIGTGTVFAKVYVAYDNTKVYVAAQIKEPNFGNNAGQPQPNAGNFPGGMPGGIFTIHRFGDALSFAFGCRHRVPLKGGRSLDDPWCWKGHFFDTDYYFTAHTTATQGDVVIQHWTDNSPRRWGYQTLNLPEHKKVPGSEVKISRSGTTTIYELSIPRSIMPLFDPTKMDACRFGFIVINGEQASKMAYDLKDDMQYSMQYARGVGVFDHWNKFISSWGPSWNPLVPCQTRFAIEGGVFNPSQELPEQTPTVPPGYTGGCVVEVQKTETLNQHINYQAVPAATTSENLLGRKVR